MSIHDGHRSRKREQFLRHGLDAFADHEVLELLLFYALPRRDTNEIAHRLLGHFGSLEAVFSADVEELQKVEGIGENAATLLALVLPLQQRVRLSTRAKEVALATSAAAGAFVCDLFFGEKEEKLYVLCLDGKGRLLSAVPMGEGGMEQLNLNSRRFAQIVLSANASAVILAHNHPSGVALPSPEDLRATGIVKSALETLGVALADHIIVADDDFVSLRDSGEL